MILLINLILSLFKISLVVVIAMAIFFLEVGVFDWMIFDRLDDGSSKVQPILVATALAMLVIAIVGGIKGMWWIWYDVLGLGVI